MMNVEYRVTTKDDIELLMSLRLGGNSVQDGDIFMFGPMRNIKNYISNMEHLLGFENDFDFIYPSHGSFPVQKDLIGKLIEGAKNIVAGKSAGNQIDMFGNKVMLYKFDFAGFLCDLK